jgi:DNA polymerase III epsilon subunit-like protein
VETKMSDISEGPLTQAEMPYRLDCIVMDTETTGFRVDEGHRLIEVATVEVEDWQVEPIGWATLVKPLREIPPGATLVHKITDEMVEDAPLPVDVGVGLRFRIGDTALAFHNANFDLPFLQQFFSDEGVDARARRALLDRSKPFTCYLSSDGKRITGWKDNTLGYVVYSKTCKLGRLSFTHGKEYRSIVARDIHGGLWYGRGSPGICITLRAKKA